MGQMIPITLPADGNWPTIVGDSIMIIGPRQNELTEEQRYFNPVYLMTYPGKEHLKAQMIRAGACDCDLTKPNRRIGVFSVAPDKKVSFSQGNLQCLPAINLWKFANTQYEYLGNANKYLKPTFRNWVDLFGWSANNTTAPFGVSTSTNVADYAGDFVDWGTNTICGDAPGTWRTLSVDEWGYLFQGRKNATQLYSKGNIDGLRGMIILPDNWVMPEGLHFTAQPTNLTMELDINTYTQAEWQRMEEAGAVFLCPTGRRDGTKIDYLEYYGGYWSSSKISNSNHVCHMYYNYKSKIFMTDYKEGDYSYGTNGRAVRLVHDTIVPPPAPCETFKVNSVTFNMMCVEGGTFMMGATENDTDAENDEYPQHQVTVSDFMIGQTEVTQELWTAVMGTNPSKNQGNYLPVEQVTWDECQEFVAKLNQLTGKHFRLPTEAEWEFAARGGNKSKGYKYSGSDNLSDVAWYEGNSAGKTHNVGTKLPNELGIFDMSGNVYEKCQDWYAPYTAEAQVNPQGPAEPQTHRVVRGGCSGSQATNNSERVCRVINRGYARTTSRESITGLRLVLDTAEYIPAPEPAKRIGVFSVAKDKQVSFSQGNLQYIQSTDTWQFAANQLEYMGHKHYRNGQLADTIEYFGWSGKNSKTPWGISLSTESSDYAGEFLDWGINTIAGSAPNTWRTLSNDEWLYICQGRKNADQLLGLGTIGTVTGLIILPDDWQLPAGLSFTPNTDNATKNQYTYNQWAVMENAGAVFIATSGYFNPKLGGMRHVGGEGHIRTNALSDNGLQVYSVIKTNKIIYSYSGTQEQNLQYAFAQRLVHDTIVPMPEPEYVDLGLSVKWATFNVGATSPEDYGYYFAWGETEPKETYSWATYKWCDGTDANITKYNTADGKTILEPADDAAQVQWGGNWRMPTEEEQQELIDRCSWERTNLNGVIGYKVTGPNGNSIFIPIAGAYNSFDNQLNSVGSIGWIYSSTKATGTRAYEIHIEEGIILQKDCSRCVGLTIRPVYDDKPPKRIGVFSVAADKQVSFSQGNLQYTQSTDEWRFAREQYEYIGAANIKDGNLADRIDMFGWSADNTTAPFGVSTSTNDADYTGEFVDWGVNTICGEAPGTWRTLSADEWEYLLNKRKNASDLYGVAQVAGVNGMIILPNDWEEANGIVFKSGLHSSQVNDYSVYQSFTDAQWLAMENAGAVFLPALGYRDGTNVEKCNTSGYYWSNTTSDEKSAYRLYFYSYFLAPNDVHSKYRGRSVRLVHDTIVPKAESEYVDLGLSVKWATFNVGATSPEDYGDYFAWGETEPKETYSWATYKWCDGTSSNITKYNSADGKTVLDLDDDAAYVNWGDKWRMPTKEECQELLDKCTWKEETRNGINGHIVTGPNGNSIFIPTTGYHNDDNGTGVQGLGTITYLWTSSTPGNANAYDLLLSHPTLADGIGSNTRRVGMPIRPVYDEVPDPCLVVKVNDTLSINLMCVEGGTFMMGSDAPDAEADEGPVHKVTLSDFYIGETEVTQQLWQLVMDTNPSKNKGAFLPIESVTWTECQTFVEKLSEMTGLYFRLPTEAEWEYAARGGQRSQGYTYAGSNDIDQVGWYNGNSSNKTHAVGQKQPNELGIYDMTGNVWEYCYDWHMPYSAQAQTNPTGAATGDKHVLRGGCYHYDSKNCTNTNRHSYYTPDKGGASTGLRIVLEP